MTCRLKCRIDPEPSPYSCILPEHKPVRREMIDLLAVEEPKHKPATIRAVSYEAAIDKFVQTHAVVWSGPNPTSGQYSQGPGTQRKTSPATATWQTDGNDR
jgi:hypothetical protein